MLLQITSEANISMASIRQPKMNASAGEDDARVHFKLKKISFNSLA